MENLHIFKNIFQIKTDTKMWLKHIVLSKLAKFDVKYLVI